MSMHRRNSAVVLSAALLLGSPALAQTPPGPPPVLVVTVEEIKPGSMGAHEKSVGSYFALYERAKVASPRIGLQPVSGDVNHVVYLEAHESFADIEAATKRHDEALAANPALQAELERLDRESGPFHVSQKSMIATFRPDLSYQPLAMDSVAKARYFNMTTTVLNPGKGTQYTEYMKQLNTARQKAQVADIHTAVYQVTSGSAPGTYLTFFTDRSLAEEDAFRTGAEARNKAISEALGGESVVKQRAEQTAQIFAPTSGTSSFYSVNRALSQPAPQFAAFDPDFWAPKAPGKALAVKKETKKQ
jgi:hypothetical protein